MNFQHFPHFPDFTIIRLLISETFSPQRMPFTNTPENAKSCTKTCNLGKNFSEIGLGVQKIGQKPIRFAPDSKLNRLLLGAFQ